MSDSLNITQDFIDFLQRGAVLDFKGERCSLGEIQWHTLEELTRENLLFQSYGSALEKSDPNNEKEGGYLVPAVSLIAQSTGYPSHFLFCWLPEEGCFASGDEEHGHLWILPGVSWSQIEQDPIPYLEAQWDLDEGKGKLLTPWPRYPFVTFAEWEAIV